MARTGMVASGDKVVSRKLTSLMVASQDVSGAWPEVGQNISMHMRKQFRSSGAHLNGKPWQPLAPATVKAKVRAGKPTKPLVYSGKLRRSFTGRPMGIERYTPKSAVFGSRRKTAVWQHYGTFVRGKRHIPPRKIMRVNREIRSETADIIKRWLLKKAGI